jgi:hypothetical protein
VQATVSAELPKEQLGECLLVWAQETEEKWQPGCKQSFL